MKQDLNNQRHLQDLNKEDPGAQLEQSEDSQMEIDPPIDHVCDMEVDDCDTQTGKGLIVRQDKLFKLPGIQNRKIKKRKNKVQWIKY